MNKEAKRRRADLFIIGTHGRRGFDRFILGSVAEGVIRLAGMPILVIHGRQGFQILLVFGSVHAQLACQERLDLT